MDWSELDSFFKGFGAYALVFILSLIIVGRIKDLRSRAFTSAAICFGFMGCPTLFLMTLGLAMSANPGILDVAIFLAVFVVQASVAAFYGLAIFKRNIKLIVLSSLSVVGVVLGLVYLIFFQDFDWRTVTTNPGVIWDKVLGTPNDDSAECIIETTSGDLLVAANTWSTERRSDVLVVKLDELGNKIWEKTYGGNDIDRVHRILSTPDGYIMVGETRSYGSGGENVWLVKLDTSGNIQWQRTFGGPSNDTGENIQLTPDNGFIVAGKTWTSDNGKLVAWLIKTDAQGQEEWRQTYEADNGRWCKAKDVVVVDGGYVLIGDTWSPNSGLADQYTKTGIWAKKLDNKGNETWHREFFPAKFDAEAIGVHLIADGSYIIVGNAPADEPNYDRALWLIKVTTQGDEEWNKKFGGLGYDRFISSILTREGNILATGNHFVDSIKQEYVLIQVNPEGKELWTKALDKLKVSAGRFSLQTRDGNYVATGNIAHDFDQLDIWVVKFSAIQ